VRARTAAQRRRLTIAVLAASAAAVWSLNAGPALALDYERNDVSVRSLGVAAGIASTPGRPVLTWLHGTARHHVRFVYFGMELNAGLTFQPHPFVAAGGFAGVETATSAYTRMRGYAQAGARYLLSSHARPFIGLEAGVRLESNLARPAGGVLLSTYFVFD
jgi:hypothetical protein